MPYQKNGVRNYLAEKLWEQKTHPERIKQRAERNTARRRAGLKVGDPRQADHIKELVRGGSNSPSNVRIVSARTNLEKEAKRKQRMAKKK